MQKKPDQNETRLTNDPSSFRKVARVARSLRGLGLTPSDRARLLAQIAAATSN